jgi:hypothetical protein
MIADNKDDPTVLCREHLTAGFYRTGERGVQADLTGAWRYPSQATNGLSSASLADRGSLVGRPASFRR